MIDRAKERCQHVPHDSCCQYHQHQHQCLRPAGHPGMHEGAGWTCKYGGPSDDRQRTVWESDGHMAGDDGRGGPRDAINFEPVGTDARSVKTVFVIYRNHRGEETSRDINPMFLWWGATEWHPTPQWILRAYCFQKESVRDFAIADIVCWGEAKPTPAKVYPLGAAAQAIGEAIITLAGEGYKELAERLERMNAPNPVKTISGKGFIDLVEKVERVTGGDKS